MNDQKNHFIIGKNISWKSIQPYLLRIKHFSPLAHVTDQVVKTVPSMPYAILEIECLELKSELILYVNHKIDFLHLWRAYEERGVAENEEVIVADFSQTRRGIPRLLGHK